MSISRQRSALSITLALQGAGVRQADQKSISIGTVVTCLAYSERYSPSVNCCVGPALQSDHYYKLTFDTNGTGMLDWYLRHYAADSDLPTLTQLAREVPFGAAGLTARPCAYHYSGLSGFLNGSARHTRARFFRAILESTASTVVDLAEQLGLNRPGGIVATGGGARNPFLLQIIADMSGSEVQAPCCPEPASRGAGLLAAVAAGWYTNVPTAAEACVNLQRKFVPDPAAHDQYARWREQCRI